MSVMTAGRPTGLARAPVPVQARRGRAGRSLCDGGSRAVVSRAGGPGAGVSRAGVSRARVSRAGVSCVGRARTGIVRAGVAPAGVARVGVARPARSWQAQRPGPARLTRRGRVVVMGLLTAAALLAAVLLWLTAARAQAASGGSPPGSVYRNLTSVVVHPGQTLWSIALRVQPSADPRIVVQQIIEFNALTGTGIEPGERLWVPRR